MAGRLLGMGSDLLVLEPKHRPLLVGQVSMTTALVWHRACWWYAGHDLADAAAPMPPRRRSSVASSSSSKANCPSSSFTHR